ncbi:MAG: tRNA dimethylallyltransferase [Glaciecola sp. HTCC2999]|jgi:tRNA dimethylallyltransferase|nr:MAG: tRNA dimethylallyltransferase [Glaciecola sp. HTCC2999]
MYQVATEHHPAQVIFIMGPTASGKTALALALAQQIECEIISVDSALIYKEMDIGTAKPTTVELEAVPHHLIDILDPSMAYSVSQFRDDAVRLISQIIARGRLPVLVGGTMMYYNALIKGLSTLPASNSGIRADIEAQARQKGWTMMHSELAQVDPICADRIHPNDPQRITRALEVYQISGQPMSALQAQSSGPIPYSVAQFAIAPQERSILHERIELRFRQMLAQNFEAEVQALMDRGDLMEDLPSIRCVGYRQMWQYLSGQMSRAEMVERGIIATRQLAKRQITWLRGWDDVHWLDTFATDNIDMVLKLIKK